MMRKGESSCGLTQRNPRNGKEENESDDFKAVKKGGLLWRQKHAVRLGPGSKTHKASPPQFQGWGSHKPTMGEITDKKPRALCTILSWRDCTHSTLVTFWAFTSNHGYSSIILMYPSSPTRNLPGLSQRTGIPFSWFPLFPPRLHYKSLSSFSALWLPSSFSVWSLFPPAQQSAPGIQYFTLTARCARAKWGPSPSELQRDAHVGWRKKMNEYGNDAFP